MFDILVNPHSGKGKSLAALKTVETILTGKQIPYTVHRTAYAGHATEIVRELNKRDECKLIVMGGDGSFNEALNGIEDFSKITVGFIPCGTGNDYVKAAKIPTDVKKALELILKGEEGYTDFIQLDDRRALNATGAGMDVDVLVKYSQMKAFRGKMKYYASLIYTAIHLRYPRVRIEIGDRVEEKEIIIVSIANGIYIGGGMAISPKSEVNDGLMDVVLIGKATKLKKYQLLLQFLSCKHLTNPVTEHFRCSEIKITLLDDDSKSQVDGEVFDNKVMNCKLMHNVLRTYK